MQLQPGGYEDTQKLVEGDEALSKSATITRRVAEADSSHAHKTSRLFIGSITWIAHQLQRPAHRQWWTLR